MEREQYFITVEVRNENGEIIENQIGIHTIKEKEINFEISAKDSSDLEYRVRQIARTIKSWLPKDYEINITASVYNSISNTYMTMHSFYVNEDRFISH